MTRLRMFAASLIILIAATLISLYPGHMVLHWLGYKITMPVGMVFAGMLVIFFILITLHRLWSRLWKLPQRYQRYLQNRRLQKSDDLLIGGITALAAGRHDEARRFCELAGELNPDNPLGIFLGSQAAQNLGDTAEAERIFMRMGETPQLRFLGLRGLYIQAKQRQDWQSARQYLQQIWKIHPDSPWIIKEFLRVEILVAYYGLTPGVSEDPSLRRHLDKPAAQRHEAALLWCRYKNMPHHPKDDGIYALLHKIHNQAQDWILPALRLAEYHINNNSPYKAQKVLAAAYKANPHRSIAVLWRTLAKNVQDAVGLYNFFGDLTAADNDHYESRLILAKAAIEAKLWGQAESCLEQLSLMTLNQRVCRLWAEYYEAGPVNRRHKSREWWVKASQAAPDRCWQCASCAKVHEVWDIVCSCCHDTDVIVWSDPALNVRPQPEIGETAISMAGSMLYLKYKAQENNG